MTVLRMLSALVVPVGALFAAYLAVPRLADVPPSLTGLKSYAPHIALALGLALSVGFGRSRTFFALAILAVAYAAVRGGSHADPVYRGVTAALPLTFAVLAWRRETPLFTAQGLRYGAAVAASGALLVALCVIFPAVTLPARIAPGLLGEPTLVATVIGVIVACAAWLHRREAAALALAAAIVAFALASHPASDADRASLLVAAGALVPAIAVLQDIFQMAFRDPLTGLMSRRALDEHMAALGQQYVIAMVDVDHFKRVNDAHGHDTGDEVLKMVAAMLARARGARAYRYGGEEFALLYPGQDTDEVWEALQALREEIAGYPFRLRAAGRSKIGRVRRNRKATAVRALKVTVSIGVAQPDNRNTDPQAVLAMADKALYRAKHGGRNAVCRFDRRR